MNIDPQTRELLAHAIDAMASTLALCQSILDASEPEGCPHPPEQVVCLTTFGGPEGYRCHQCGAEQPTPFHRST